MEGREERVGEWREGMKGGREGTRGKRGGEVRVG